MAGAAEPADAGGGGRVVAEIDVGAADTEQGDEMADEFLGDPLRFEDAADAAGDGADRLELPEVEALVEARPFEFLAELPGAEAETGGRRGPTRRAARAGEDGGSKPAMSPENGTSVQPSVACFDLARDRAGPAGEIVAVPAQHAGARTGFFDHRPQQILGELRALVAAEGGVGEAEELRQRHCP